MSVPWLLVVIVVFLGLGAYSASETVKEKEEGFLETVFFYLLFVANGLAWVFFAAILIEVKIIPREPWWGIIMSLFCAAGDMILGFTEIRYFLNKRGKRN